jgi:undecaprenyl-diphosphatase
VTSWVQATFADEAVNRALLVPSGAPILVPLLLVGALLARRRPSGRPLAFVAGPVLAVALTEVALKPLFGRHLHSPHNHRTFLDYPSGNIVALVATVTAFALLVTSWQARAAILAAGALCVAAVAVGLVWFDYHHPTDVLGGIGFGLAPPLVLRSGRPGPAPALTRADSRPSRD